MKNLILLSALCVAVLSCSKDVDLLPEGNNFSSTKSYLISLDSIKQIAQKLPSRFGNPTSTRSVHTSQQISTIIPLSNITQKQTKSSENDFSELDFIYVVDYSGENGFAIISADTRLEQVLAYSDQCTFEDAMEIPSIAGLVGNIPDYVQTMINDSLLGTEDYYIDQRALINTQTLSKGPYITTRWGQWEPFNKYISGPLYGAAVSLLQLTAYYNWPQVALEPSTGNPTYLNWPEDRAYVFGPILKMYPESAERVARAAQSIYNEVGPLGNTLTIERICNHIRYKMAYVSNYSLTYTKEDIDREQPVIMSGYATSNNEGNVWLVDGYQQITNTYQTTRIWYSGLTDQMIRTENMGQSTEVRNLLHCNWGWDGRGDGYFTAGLFAPQQANSYDFPTLGTTDNHNYRYSVTQCINFSPNKTIP